MIIAGVPVFQDLSWVTFALLAAVYFGAFFIKGVFGLGSLTPTVLFGAWVVEPHQAVLLALICNAMTQVQYLPEAVRHGDWTITRQIIVANFAAAALGVWIFGRMDASWLTLVLGLSLGAIVAADMGDVLNRLAKRFDVRSPLMAYSLSALAGFISGLTGAGGLFFLALYVKMVCPEPRKFRATIFLLAALVIVWRVVILGATGFITVPLLAESAALLPAVVLGGLVGMRAFHIIRRDLFFRAFQVVLLCAAANLIWKALRDVM